MLAELGEDARVLAGGQSLVPMLNLRLARPSALVDVGRVAELSGISANGALRLGATTRQADALRSATGRRARAAAGSGAAARRPSGHAQPRHGGRLHRACGSRRGAAGRAAGARRRGDRRLRRRGARHSGRLALPRAVRDGARRGRAAHGAAHWPPRPPAPRHGFAEIARRRGDFALAGAAVVVAPGYARVALFAVAPCAFRAARGGARARSRAPGRRRRRQLAAAAADPSDDPHATAAYRREAARVATLRALLDAGVARG